MHICYISNEYPLWQTGGIGSFIQTIGRGLVKKGHKVSVVGIGGALEEELVIDEGVEIHRLPRPSFLRKPAFIENSLRIRKKVKELHKKDPIQIVETPESSMFMFPTKTPYKKVVRMHGGHHFFAESENREINKWKGFIEKCSYRSANAFVAVSDYVKSHTEKYLSTKGRPVEKIRYPVDENLFRQADLSITIPKRLVFAGTVCEKKGIRQLMQALELILPEFPDVHLDVYGRDWYFPDHRSYTEFLKTSFSQELLSHVTFHGALKLSEIPSKYEQAELCVFPSHMETQGLVAPEAMIMGKPVLFSTAGPGPETIKHQDTGLLCNPLNHEDIAAQILFALRNPEKMKEIALRGQKSAKEMFNIDAIIEKNIEFYEAISNGTKNR